MATLLVGVLMGQTIYTFLSDDVIRMCTVHEINAQEYMVNALQEHIHEKALVRACTRFNRREREREEFEHS